MTVYTFDNLAAFGEKVVRNATRVTANAAQDVFREAQKPKAKGGRMPVDKGQLRNSLTMSANGSGGLTGESSYVLALANMKPGDTIQGGWTAAHALRQEKGFVGQDKLGRTYNQAGNFFMRSAAARWQEFVAAQANRLRG